MINCKTILIDKRNYDEILPGLLIDMGTAVVVGLDTETENTNAHDGIKEFRKAKEGKAFDYRRMVITGFSVYPDLNADEPVAYYVNLNHSDVENRLTWEQAKVILDAKKPDASWIAHNAVYEITVFKRVYNWDVGNVIDTLQMAVSAYGPDEYDHMKYVEANLGAMQELFLDAEKLFKDFNPSESRDKMSPAQTELLSKVLGKTSAAKYSYNGVIADLAYGYGLKKAVWSFFEYKMTTYEESLNGKDHMGQLSGEEVKDYGAEDAYWAVKLFYRLYQFMKDNCPDTIPTFFSQENPMAQVFAEIRQDGLRVNSDAIEKRKRVERANFAKILREIKAVAATLLPFPVELNEKLAKFDKWYNDKGQNYRDKAIDWITSPDSEDDFEQCCQISSAVSNAWAGGKCDGISLGHYYQARIFMYDLCRFPPIIYKGKVQSDAETRGELRDKFKKEIQKDPTTKDHYEKCDKLLKLMGEMASIEQRMKLYLTPYQLLTDPETSRMYPEVSSMLATRRMACSNPNGMQLSKRGESTYVRGFYLADEEDHVLVSLDWSQIELVLIGELSGDPEFFKAYGQLPYQDLHLGAAADVLGVVIEGVTPELLKNMHKMEADTIPSALLIKPNGEALTPGAAKKFWRTEVGKGSNFNYWYSGALSTVGDKLGWTSEQMWAATDAYRTRFAVAEAWRVGIIEQAKWDGFVTLPDGHKRTRWEITHEWTTITNRMFEQYLNVGHAGVYKFGQQVMKAVRSRAGNQLVNAVIQGSSATLAKRSIIKIRERIKAEGFDAKFKMPIHDELLFSVHKSQVVAFIKMAKEVMTNHPDIVRNLKIDCTASVGRTFEPYDKVKAPLGQIELDEVPDILGFVEGSKCNDNQIEQVVEYLYAA